MQETSQTLDTANTGRPAGNPHAASCGPAITGSAGLDVPGGAYDALVQMVAQAVFQTDADGIVTADSPAWRAGTGQLAEEWLGRSWLDAVHPDERAQAALQWQDARKARHSFNMEIRLRSAAGGWRWTNILAAPLAGPDGSICTWLGMSIDITRRKTQDAAELHRSNERYKAIFEFIDEGFCIMERVAPGDGSQGASGEGGAGRAGGAGTPLDFRLVTVNAAYEKHTGHANAVGRTLRELFPQESDDWLHTYDEILRSGEPVRFERTFNSVGRILDLYAFRIQEHGQDYVAAVFADVTERKRWEAALRESEQRARDYVKKLEEADQNKNRFLSTLSHELRNPLATIVMSFSVLEQAPPDSDQARRARDAIIRQTTQMKRLVDDLLDVTRINLNKLSLKKERIELVELVEKTLADYRKGFADKGVQLSAVLPPRPVFLYVDPARLTQVIGNLLHNAQKFTDAGGEVVVAVSIDAMRSQAVIEVRDTGIGMPPELQRNLFQPFTQADTSIERKQGGLGLGLAVVKGMVEQHGGSVQAESDGLGKGSRFTVRLPLPHKPANTTEQEVKMDEPLVCPLKALIIEDNPDLQEVLLQLLDMLGHEADGANNGATGIAKARASHPDVILCDIGLPDMSGYEVAQAIRRDPELSSVFLVALSGYAQPEDLERSRQAGFQRHLAKPVGLETLKQTLAEAAGEC